jgi:glycosyltransferase involved in cell wall biosynthesis
MKIKSKKIVFLINTLGSGGAQRQILLLAQNIASSTNFDVNLIHYGESEDMVTNFSNLNFKILRVPRGGRLKILSGVYSVIRELNPNCIISFIDTPNIFSGIYAIINRDVTWIACERNLSTGFSFFGVFWRLFFYFRADFVVSNSHSQDIWIKKWLPFYKRKCKIVYNGIPNNFYQSNLVQKNLFGKRKILAFARLSVQKNPMLLLRALENLSNDDRAKIDIEWYGDDDPSDIEMRSKLIKIANASNLPIKFLNAISDVNEKMKFADALILCSLFEGTPNVVLEAMSARLLVISSSVADLPSILGDQRGILYKSNEHHALCSSIKSFLNMTPIEVNSMTESAYIFSLKNFSSIEMSRKYLDLINSKLLN